MSRDKRQGFLSWTAADGRKRQENQTNEARFVKRAGSQHVARRATDHRGAKGRKEGREHVFVALNRQSRGENMFSWRSTDIGDVNV
jgi:hypothetical protein